MKRVLLLTAVLAMGCDGVPEAVGSDAVTTDAVIGTWQAGRATLALTPTGDYTYIAPNGAIVGFARWSVSGRTLRREGFPDAKIALSGDTMVVSTPGEGGTGTIETFRRAATYCTPTDAMQSCR